MVVAGLAAPILGRRLRAPRAVVQAVACGAPFGLCIAVPRSRARDVATCALQMAAYTNAYKSPHDDPESQLARVRVDYPIAVDRWLGRGELPSVRLQRALHRPGRWTPLDRVLVLAHWIWFPIPHGALVYVMVRRPERFERAAALTYAVFDIGAVFYWLIPTAPPWWAAKQAVGDTPLPERGTAAAQAPGEAPVHTTPAHAASHNGGAVVATVVAVAGAPGDVGSGGGGQAADPADRPSEAALRRLMVEYGEHLWGDRWERLYSVFGGNPLAAMPSLHFATSVMAATLLDEVGPVAGAVGWTYTATLGLALVYLGEHYVADLLAGAGLALAIRRIGPRAAPALLRVRRAVAAIEAAGVPRSGHGQGSA